VSQPARKGKPFIKDAMFDVMTGTDLEWVKNQAGEEVAADMDKVLKGIRKKIKF
jgi:hypothetical protein